VRHLAPATGRAGGVGFAAALAVLALALSLWWAPAARAARGEAL
jgi:hypothetical protein